VHQGGSGRGALLNYWGGSHFYGGLESVQKNERREKVLGPWLLYANGTQTAGTPGQDEMWADAKRRLVSEKAAWPYSWEKDARYLPKSARGAVQGHIAYNDPQELQASAANAWVGLADPPVAGLPNFEHQGWDYQYWVHADTQGNFVISNVRPGNYTLHAMVAGVHGVYVGQASAVTVSAGTVLSLGNVVWVPDRLGPTAWEIGKPDRAPQEFFRGDQAWHFGTNLLFAKDFPTGITYVIGTSTPAKNWNYLQPGGTWNVQFNLGAIPTQATGASLVLDIAGADVVTLSASMNGTQVGTVKTSYDDGSIDRDQPHGAWRTARISVPVAAFKVGTNRLAIASSGRVMWDYLRMEWVTP
jgi:rhamnogalacturonan endolyase